MGFIYQTTLAKDPQPHGRRNHGARWTSEQYAELKHLWFCTDKAFATICDEMGRSWAAVIAKLSEQKWVKYDPIKCAYTYQRNSRLDDIETETNTQFETPKEEIMSNANIETKTFIAGADAANMDDAQVFRHIAKLEQEIDKLKAIRAKSTKLSAAVAALEKDVADLVAYVDAR